MSDHSNPKDSFSPNNTNYLTTATATSQQGNPPNAAQIIQQVFNNPLLQQQQSIMNSNAMASFFANSLAAFQAVQQQQPPPNISHFQGFDPSVLFNQMAMLSSITNQAAAPSQLLYGGATDETALPTYVNPKQYARILKRRDARRIMDEYFARKRKQREEKKPYMHESRHKHAMKRPRGPGGRFLTKEELEGLKHKDDGDEEEEELEDYKDNSKPINSESSSSVSEKKKPKTS